MPAIRISEELKDALANRMRSKGDTYEDVIWDLIEDTLELSEHTKHTIEASRAEAARGETVSLDELEARVKDPGERSAPRSVSRNTDEALDHRDQHI
jgi:predicted transcriptional regulator